MAAAVKLTEKWQTETVITNYYVHRPS